MASLMTWPTCEPLGRMRFITSELLMTCWAIVSLMPNFSYSRGSTPLVARVTMPPSAVMVENIPSIRSPETYCW